MTTDYALCRDGVALFDLSTESRFSVSGPAAETALNALTTIDVSSLRPWRGKMALFLAPDASIIALATIFRADACFYIFAEATVADRLRAYLGEEIAARGATLTDLSLTHCLYSVVGPSAQEVMIAAAGDDVVGLPFLSGEYNAELGATVFRMGNTGEFEYRMMADLAQASGLAARLCEHGASFGIAPVAAEVMKTLLLEMRALSHNDIPVDTSPLEAGVHWMVNFRKEQPVAAAALHQSKAAPRTRCVAVTIEGVDAALPGNSRLLIEDQDVGVLASSEYSQALGKYVGVAYVAPEFGWVGVSFVAHTPTGGHVVVRAVSAPMLVTKTAKRA
ncbi:glycine cleavage T C-terminal barrel domain-containing protein [Paraburkholderia terricola]|uniref:Glycine cleavage system aminomethyltransferase T n=1 Tax=Paraburkholderia terricola TaxID=169427 RepID=A0ABU1M1F8_9BURK|nr:glycine cleavage T C-terminal barrel domain-containing protein [Paraburkholderia terricola]MDR6412840.1 glycine cleavage system aminomethyltransferase T [Paraburkholderia terricola]MDR6450048.1 glycine cleavage system aminomethyltransferase T [Paraburkholderia terricola]MDR6484888.1 glycine cleavage system aminomethyltransferase T [Paraburkholderia terricola]